ncbi:hypothetical protein H7I00_16360, partial [Mycobacterium bohemicum]|nr:hypothetical protein [Mycobacterium bohemicum]
VDPGPATAVAGSPEHAALFDLPLREPAAALFDLPLREPAHPTPAGLVAAVPDWSQRPQPLVALYLRRPDAKPLQAPR